MVLHNEPNVKQEQKIIKIIVAIALLATVLGVVFFFAGNFLPSTKSLASGGPSIYTLSGNSNSSSNINKYNQMVNGDTIKITGLFKVKANHNNLQSKNIVILINSGSMRWDGGYYYKIGPGAKLFLKNGGNLSCNGSGYGSNATLYFGSNKLVSYNGGGGANYSFSQVMTAGGVQQSGLGPLPVKLVRFETILEKGKVNLLWSTASEINNDRFEIERSNDNKTWKVIGTVKGNGNSTTVKNYSYADNPGIITGAIYYRLHQLDYNGDSEYGPVSVVDNKKREKEGKVYPNPANDVIKISLNAGTYQLSIMDLSGTSIISKQVDTDFETVDIDNLPNGNYIVKMENETISESHRIVVRH